LTKWVLIVAGGLWPLIAAMGGQGYSPLITLGGMLCVWGAAPRMKLRFYLIVLAAAREFIAASARWSPRPISVIDLDLAHGSIAIRLEVLRLGSVLLWGGVLMEAARTLSARDAQLVVRVATIGILVQLVLVALAALFERNLLALFYPKGNFDEGVQNISRNSLQMALAAPMLIVGLGRTMTFTRALAVEVGVFLAISLALIARGVDAGIVSVGVGIGCVAVVRLFPRSGFRIIGGLLSMIVVTAPLSFGWLTRVTHHPQVTDSTTWRLAIWTRVLRIIHENPVFGAGLGVLRTIDDKIPDGPQKGQLLVPNHSHNMVLQLWAESGAIGATLVALAILCASFRMPRPGKLGVSGYLAAALAGQ
jgi:O-antigen ligase